MPMRRWWASPRCNSSGRSSGPKTARRTIRQPSTAGPGIPTILSGLMYSGPYMIPNIKGVVRGVYPTTTPVNACRGAGRPEATYMLERLVDQFAHQLAMDPVDVRRKNLIPKESFPYTVATGITYD